MRFLTREDYIEKTKQIKYWRRSRDERWNYISVVINELKKYDPMSILEVGSYSIPLSYDSYLIAQHKHQLVNENGIVYNLNNVPYPFEDNQFDFFIGLQVWEHLKEKQKAFLEATRISRNIILSFPYNWNKSNKVHNNINDNIISDWACNIIPTYTKVVGKRKIYFWINI